MDVLTGKQRIGAAFKRTFANEKPQMDRIPAYLITGQCNTQLIGVSIREWLLDPQVFIKAQVASYERFRPDILLMMWDLLTDVEAIGNELKYPEDSLCITTKSALEDKGKLSSLQLPDPTKEAVAETKKIITDGIVSAVIAGPWTIAIGLRGATELIMDALKDPDYVHELMQFCTRQSINFAEAIIPLGVGLGYSEAPASNSLISPEMYRSFIFPYHKQIVDHFKAKKFGVGLHICGYADPILEDMVDTGVSNISIDAPSDLAKAAVAAKGKAVLIGNLDTNLFYTGSRDEMKQAIKNCIAQAPSDSGYILSTGCEVPAIAPPEKMEWFYELVDELGGYN
jgi:uroporphyrinogen decarboxylase